MTSSRHRIASMVKMTIVLMAMYFLYRFFKDAYDELLINPVHFFEDAYMFIRYAKIWHLGFGEAWNVGEAPVYGNTSQLHFIGVLILTSAGHLSDDMVIKLSSFVPAFIFMAWLPWFCARHSVLFCNYPVYQKIILWLGLICPLVYLNTPYAYHYLTGMDTSLSILMHLLLIDAVLSYAKSKKPALLLAAVILSYLAYLTRPENILATSLFSVLYLGFILKDIPAVKKYITCLALVLVADGIVKYGYFGDFVPLAFYSKKSGFIEGNAGAGFSHPAFYFFYFLSTILPFVIIQLFSLRKDNGMQQLVFILPAVLTITYFFGMMTVMNMKGRYFYPFTPYFIAAAVVTFNHAVLYKKQHWKNALLLLVSALVFVLINIAKQRNGDIVHYFMGEPHLCDDALKMPAPDFGGSGYRVDTEGFNHVVNVLANTPEALKVAMTENGFIGAKLPTTHIIDMTGLHNPYVARHGFSARWLFEQKPDMIWMPHWHYTCMTHEILYNEQFRQQYRFYPGLFTWGVALRTSSPYYPLLKDNMEKQVAEIYPGYHLQDFEKILPGSMTH